MATLALFVVFLACQAQGSFLFWHAAKWWADLPYERSERAFAFGALLGISALLTWAAWGNPAIRAWFEGRF